jgi:hypothetical protein
MVSFEFQSSGAIVEVIEERFTAIAHLKNPTRRVAQNIISNIGRAIAVVSIAL